MTTTTLTRPSTGRARSRGRRPAVTAVAAAAASIGAITLAGMLDPGYSALSEGISALGSTESHSAPIMGVGFALMALTAVSAGVAVWRSLGGKLAAAAGILTVLAGVATAADGVFRQSCSSLQEACLARESAGGVSSDHVLHNLVALPLFLFLVIAGFLLVGAVGRNAALRPRRGWVLVGASSTLVFVVWFGSGSYADLGGLVERIMVLLAFGLPVVIGWAASRTATTD